MTKANEYDALLLVSFGGPEGRDEVMPFLENVLRGKNVPRARMLQVAEHYDQFDGVSPINEQNRRLLAAIKADLAANGIDLPLYWGNRNWHPLLPNTLQKMADDGVSRAIAFFTSAFSSYSGCRQYREDIARAQQQVGPAAPEVDKLRVFFNHPGFVEPMAELTKQAIDTIEESRREGATLLFTAHSIPAEMAANCQYEAQLRNACELVAERVGFDRWQLVFQSRSGPPTQPWLEPGIGEAIREQHASNPIRDLVVVPIGFISDHIEVLFDLDIEAKQICDELDINMMRVPTVGVHPQFVSMVRELVVERMETHAERPALGLLGPSHDVCPADCCLYSPRRPSTAKGE